MRTLLEVYVTDEIPVHLIKFQWETPHFYLKIYIIL